MGYCHVTSAFMCTGSFSKQFVINFETRFHAEEDCHSSEASFKRASSELKVLTKIV